MSQRYYMQNGSEPDIQGTWFIAGPQNEEQVPEEVKKVLDTPGVKMIAVVYNKGLGDRITVYQKLKEPEEPK